MICCGCSETNAWSMPSEKPVLVADHEARGRRVKLVEQDNEFSIFVRDEGHQQNNSKQKTVVMIHGVPASSFLYRKFFDPLVKQGYRAIAMDLPGLGLSDKPTETFDYSWPAMAKILGKILHHDDLRLGNKIHLVVHDIGGPIAALYASEHPDRVESLTVLDTMFDIESFNPPFPMFFFPLPIVGNIAIATFLPWVVRHFMYLRGVEEKAACDHDEAVAWVWLLKNNQGSSSFSTIMKSFPKNKDKKLLTQKIKNVLGQEHKIVMHIVWAEGDVAIPQSQCQYIQDNFNVKYIHKVKGKHFFQLEGAEAIVGHVHNFLQDLDSPAEQTS